MSTAEEISIELNGESKQLPQGTSIRELLDMLYAKQTKERPNKAFAAVAVEVNSHVIAHHEFDSSILNDSDRVEVVTLVGGG